MYKIAVVDDDLIVREIIKNALESKDRQVSVFENGEQFLNVLNTGDNFDLLFLDLIMPGMNGFTLLEKMTSMNRKIPTVVLTGLNREESVVMAHNHGAKSYLVKPVKPAEIIEKAEEILG
jgi:CheY-like chemotaxis protein